MVERGLIKSMSIRIDVAAEQRRRRHVEVVHASLLAVDFVVFPADPGAAVLSVTPAERMTPAEREVQALFDRYLADGGPQCVDVVAAASQEGVAALDVLGDVVAPLRVPSAVAPGVNVTANRQVQPVRVESRGGEGGLSFPPMTRLRPVPPRFIEAVT